MMNDKCPSCRVIVGLEPGNGKLCSDCLKTEGVRDCYDSYSITRSVMVCARWFAFGYPILALVYPTVQIIMGTFKWSTTPTFLMCWFFWVFNVFYLYPKIIKIPLRGKWDKLEKERQELFLAKVSGR